MFTRNRIKWPVLVGNVFKDCSNIMRAVDCYFHNLDDKGAFYAFGDNGTMTGTPTSGSGSLTTASYTLNWTAVGDRFLFNGQVTITTNGTGATSIAVALPSGYVPKENAAGYGVDDSSRISLAVKIGTGGTIAILKYDGTYPGADGKVLDFSGQFRF